jgi:hypothetical protein
LGFELLDRLLQFGLRRQRVREEQQDAPRTRHYSTHISELDLFNNSNTAHHEEMWS